MRRSHYYFYLAMLFLSPAPAASSSETVTFSSEDGLSITADIHAPYQNGESPIIVLFHQAGSSRGEYTGIVPRLNELGYNCMAVDQRSGEQSRGIENETALRARKENRPTGYIEALPDMKAALAYARRHYGKDKVIAWGSSYSAALVLKIAGDYPAMVDGVLAFSPGEYFERAGKSVTWIQDSAHNIKAPVFITSSRTEADSWADIMAAIETSSKISFVPATDGRHGSRALWKKYPDSAAYWHAVENFLIKYFPVGK